MLHYRREIDVKAIIEAVLKVRALERTNPDVSSSDFVMLIADAYRGWTGEFIDAIADYVERDIRAARRFRSWRRARSRRAATSSVAVLVVRRRRRSPSMAIAAHPVAALAAPAGV